MIKNADKVNDLIKKTANDNNLNVAEVRQLYAFERLLLRISKSEYRENFIIKGGFLISALVGVSKRTTLDLDATLKYMAVTEESLINTINDIISIDVDDGFIFTFNSIKKIREESEYHNFKVSLDATLGKTKFRLKIDVTVGDAITPMEIDYQYFSLWDNENIFIKTYNIETILAEKFETVIRRATFNTRLRDYYDIYMLMSLYEKQINYSTLCDAIDRTAKNRNTTQYFDYINEIISDIQTSNEMIQLWSNYQKNYSFAADISFEQTIEKIKIIADLINK